MNPEEQRQVELLIKDMEQERLRRTELQNTMSKMSMMNQEPQGMANLAMQQLDLGPEIDRIYHLISGHEQRRLMDGSEVWAEPEDDRLKIFSDYGAKQIFNYYLFYVTKNTLLSNYQEEQIYIKVFDFGCKLADLIFTRYEDFFYFPKPEDLFDTMKEVLKTEGHKFPHLLTMGRVDEDKVYQKCLYWSNEELAIRLRHFPMILLAITDSVHTTFLRALNGEERESLRKQMQIHQGINMNPTPEQHFSLMRPSTWNQR